MKTLKEEREAIVEEFRNLYVEIEEVMERSVLDRYESWLRTALLSHEEKVVASANSDFKSLEESYMALKDDYSEICRALGFKGNAWFGDPLESHETIIKRAKELALTFPITDEKV